MSSEIADKVDTNQFEISGTGGEALLCFLRFGKTKFVGTLLFYAVEDKIIELTMDFQSIVKLLAFRHESGKISITTTQDKKKIIESNIRIKKYDLSGAVGVVSVGLDSYKLEVNNGT